MIYILPLGIQCSRSYNTIVPCFTSNYHKNHRCCSNAESTEGRLVAAVALAFAVIVVAGEAQPGQEITFPMAYLLNNCCPR